MNKTIQLKNSDKTAIISEEDFDLISKFQWRYVAKQKGPDCPISEYAVTSYHREHVTMQWIIMGNNTEDIMIIDHKDRNGLNNTRENLRFCVPDMNRNNSKRKKSKYKGVQLADPKHCYRQPYSAHCQYRGKKLYKRFDTEIEAAHGYDKMATELFGEFAYLNFPTEAYK